MNRIRKGDTVRVISGKHKGAEGIVTQMLLSKEMAIVEGVNKIKKHQKKDHSHEESGIIEVEAGIRLSKLAIVDPKTKAKVTKVNYVKDASGNKIRVTKVSKTELKA